ncbi:MAG: hypothetical protein K2N86_00305, partial [Rikenellaceae bacterium]|nr:hypothetical protein [Rikenellaceae bacterium]
EAQTDADGNAVIYSFMVPKEKIAEVKLEADAKLKDETNPDADNIATVAPLSFLGSLEAGKRATALIGYLENGTLRVGSPENWGNVGKYQLTDDVLIQVIGGTFNDKGELRAYSGGSEFSFIIVSKSGEATLEPVSATDWIHLNDNVMTVDPNTTDSERRCRIAVKVGGQNVGIFTVVQGNAIKFTGEGDTTVEDDKVVVVGGKSTPAQVKFTISDAELAETEIVPVDNGENGVTVTVDRAAKSLTATLIAMVDASEVPEEGVSVPVNFVDINGSVQATITFVQRPARITFTTSNLTMPYSEDTHLVAVTTEGDAVWAVKSVTDASGNAISWLAATTDSKPAASGNNMTVTTQANSSVSSRTGYVRVESSYTLSKPLVVEQESTPNLSQPVDMGNGIEWMRVNLANPRQAAGGATFATKLPSQCTGVRAESHGKFYQWGVNVAWSSTGALDGGTPSGTWNTSSYPTNWNTNPCPDGYRLPTYVEFQSLINNTSRTNGGAWSETDYGYIILTSKAESFNKLEFPAVGNRGTDGTLYNAGSVGYYWASVIYDSNNAYELWFDGSGVNPHGNNSKRRGFSVRCVKGEETPIIDEIEMGDLKWAKYNLANPRQADGGATFATKLPSECSGVRAESHGKFYQWGVNVAWSSTGALDGGTPNGTWNTSTYPDNWTSHPCPNGYRLPTDTDFQSLINNSTRTNGGGWSATDYGYITLSLKTDSSKKLEFPAVGCRNTSGTLVNAGIWGDYWSSTTQSSEISYNLYFTSGEVNVGQSNKQSAISVRCVKGEETPIIDEIEMGDLKWAKYNLANPRQADGGATFATKLPSECSGVRAESHGKFYQWGVNVAWSSTGALDGGTPNGTWNTSTYPDNWTSHPCPNGYRLPTDTDFQSLINNSTRTNGGGWSATDYGYITLSLKTDSSKKLEFPAVGCRNTSGTLVNAGIWGDYWSSTTQSSEISYNLYFTSGEVNVGQSNKQSAINVR